MKMHPHFSQAGFSLVETLMGALAATILGAGVFSILNTGAMLSARNLALNMTNNSLRTALDRTEQLLQQADSMPTLIDTSGNTCAEPAAGISFDSFVGAPYVLTAPVTGLPAITAALVLQRSTDPLASPPIPAVGDIVHIDGEAATLRPRVSAIAIATPDALLHQTMTATLAASLGSAVTGSSTTLTAKLLRRVALIVMPNGANRELRYYPSYDLTSDLNDATKYVVLTDQIGMQSDDATPFTLITSQSESFVNLSLRVRSNRFDQLLLGKQGDQFNTFARVDVQIRPKVNP